jgi:hypothetical protein
VRWTERRQKVVHRARLAIVAGEHGDALAGGHALADLGDSGGELSR